MKLKYSFVVNEVNGHYVAVTTGRHLKKFSNMIQLNELGAFIFKMLKKNTTRDKIIAAVQKEHPDASPEQVESSVDAFIAYLQESELLA